MKLVAREPESPALLALLDERHQTISSALARVEVLRAVARARAGAATRRRAEEVLNRIPLLRVDQGILRKAAEIQPPELRSLDAIHLASALSVGDDLDCVVSYDRRLTEAAKRAGLALAAPA